jgi:hypothetical protein
LWFYVFLNFLYPEFPRLKHPPFFECDFIGHVRVVSHFIDTCIYGHLPCPHLPVQAVISMYLKYVCLYVYFVLIQVNLCK